MSWRVTVRTGLEYMAGCDQTQEEYDYPTRELATLKLIEELDRYQALGFTRLRHELTTRLGITYHYTQPTTGRSRPYANFTLHEELPYIERNYHRVV